MLPRSSLAFAAWIGLCGIWSGFAGWFGSTWVFQGRAVAWKTVTPTWVNAGNMLRCERCQPPNSVHVAASFFVFKLAVHVPCFPLHRSVRQW